MKSKMHRRLPSLMAMILIVGAVWLIRFPEGARAQEEVSLSPAMASVGTKDLGARGEKIIPSMDLSDAELTVVLRAIARFSGLNIIASDEVVGKVSLYLEDVSVRSALDAILTTNNYGYIYRDNVVYVLPAARLGEDRVRTITRVYFLQYLNAVEVEESLSQVFSGSGAGGAQAGGSPISSNPSSNSIIITDTPDQVEKIVALLEEIDRPFKQVRIDSRLVEFRIDVNQQLGIDWTYFEQGSEQNRLDINLSPWDRATGMTRSAGMFQFGLVRDGGKTLQGFIQANEDANNVRILANPSVTALHNTKAIIRITNDIPYVEANISQGVITESVSFRETGITLEVTPRINDEGNIIMKVRPSQKIAGPRIILQNSNAFPVDERSVETELRIPDNTTVVIGGLRSSETGKTRQKVPGLGDIPVLGAIFTRRLDTMVQTDLLLFITPSIVQDHRLTQKEEKNFNAFEQINRQLHRTIEEDDRRIQEDEERRLQREARRAERQQQRESAVQQPEPIREPVHVPVEPMPEPESVLLPKRDWEGDWSSPQSDAIAVQGQPAVTTQ